MQREIITRRPDLVIRRQILGPGEPMPWQVDPCRRFTVVVRGESLRIEFRGGDEPLDVPVHAGLADWEEPEARVHRGVNTGSTPYEEVVLFFLPAPDADPQPEVESAGGLGSAV